MGWDDVEKVLFHVCYSELRVAPEEHPVLMVLPPMAPTSVRQKFCQIWFENFNAPAAYFVHPAVLDLIAIGSSNMTGISVISGNKCTYITPVYCGHALDYLTKKVDIGGQQVSNALNKLLSNAGHSFITTAELAIVEDIKEKLCYVADSDTAPEAAKYELPDGQEISIGKERTGAPEVIFQPSLAEMDDELALHRQIVNVIQSCLPFMRTAMFKNIVVSGGNTTFKGFEERLKRELAALVPDQEIQIKCPPERKYLTWIGGSLLSSMPCFPHMCITNEEYNEHGPVMVDRKCF